MMDSAGNPREMVTIRARDKTTGKDLILNVPKDASMEEVRARARNAGPPPLRDDAAAPSSLTQVMAEYTRKFNEQEGKELSKDEFRRARRVRVTTLALCPHPLPPLTPRAAGSSPTGER